MIPQLRPEDVRNGVHQHSAIVISASTATSFHPPRRAAEILPSLSLWAGRVNELERQKRRPILRDETTPDDAIVVVRGGPTSIAKVLAHAQRTHDAFVLDGQPIWGILCLLCSR